MQRKSKLVTKIPEVLNFFWYIVYSYQNKIPDELKKKKKKVSELKVNLRNFHRPEQKDKDDKYISILKKIRLGKEIQKFQHVINIKEITAKNF